MRQQYCSLVAMTFLLASTNGFALTNPPEYGSPPDILITSSGVSAGPNGYPPVSAWRFGPSGSVSITATATKTTYSPYVRSISIQAAEELECSTPGDVEGFYTRTYSLGTVASAVSTALRGSASLSVTYVRTIPGSPALGGSCIEAGDIVLRRNLRVWATAIDAADDAIRSDEIIIRHVVGLRVMTFNLHFGRIGDGQETIDSGAAATFLRTRRPDVVLLQEIDKNVWRGEFAAWFWNGYQVDTLSKQLGMDFRDPTSLFGDSYKGKNAILSKIPLSGAAILGSLQTSCIPGTPDDRPVIGATLAFSDVRVNVWTAHFQHDGKGACDVTDFDGTAMHCPADDGPSPCEHVVREHQAAEWKNIMETRFGADTNRFVAGGDLNDGVTLLPAFDAAYGESYESAARELAPRIGNPQIDEIFYPSPALPGLADLATPTRQFWWTRMSHRFEQASTDPTINPSDHSPTMAILEYMVP